MDSKPKKSPRQDNKIKRKRKRPPSWMMLDYFTKVRKRENDHLVCKYCSLDVKDKYYRSHFSTCKVRMAASKMLLWCKGRWDEIENVIINFNPAFQSMTNDVLLVDIYRTYNRLKNKTKRWLPHIYQRVFKKKRADLPSMLRRKKRVTSANEIVPANTGTDFGNAPDFGNDTQEIVSDFEQGSSMSNSDEHIVMAKQQPLVVPTSRPARNRKLPQHLKDYEAWQLKKMILAVKPLNHIGNLKELARIIANSISEWNIEVCSITLDHLHFKDDKAIQAIKEVCNLSTTKWFVSLDLELYDLGIWPRQEDIGLGVSKSDREEERNGFNTRLFDTYKGLEEEYSNYLAQQLLAISPNEVEPLLPALKWWRANSRTFPNFAKMARDFLPMPRTLGALNLKFQKKRMLGALNLKFQKKDLITPRAVVFNRAAAHRSQPLFCLGQLAPAESEAASAQMGCW
ncbi:hypothetical protein V6N11_065445 [Hibiscus sabdariffa]|uniref:HAT C-terminal dimerisation domain-containing protein n=1 Tax=Hibiscus sabdariffa TaxID=183260 RepID=A0ABR2PHC7_9ROSI